MLKQSELSADLGGSAAHDLVAPAYLSLELPSGSSAGVSTANARGAKLIIGTADFVVSAIAVAITVAAGAHWLLAVPTLWFFLMVLRTSRLARVANICDWARVLQHGRSFVLLVVIACLVLRHNIYSPRLGLALAVSLTAGSTLARALLGWRPVREALGVEIGQTALVAGTREGVARTIREWEDVPEFTVVGVCLPSSDPGPSMVGGVPVLGRLRDITILARRYRPDLVAVHDVGDLGGRQLAKLQWALEDVGSQLSVITPMTNVGRGRATVHSAGRRLLIDVAHNRPSGAVALAKDLIDRLVAALALLVALPVVLTCALLVRITSPGPAFFAQARVRERGRLFIMYKLRTMRVDAEKLLEDLMAENEVGGGLFKIKNDPRITPVGRWMRKFSLDELPQLWNVVRGDMSLIGPRPALPSEVAMYDEIAQRRLAVKPGLTGLWQVSGRSNLSWDESVRIDSDYVDNWRPGRDVSIALKTVRAVLGKDGAY